MALDWFGFWESQSTSLFTTFLANALYHMQVHCRLVQSFKLNTFSSLFNIDYYYYSDQPSGPVFLLQYAGAPALLLLIDGGVCKSNESFYTSPALPDNLDYSHLQLSH
jgi:hypothetical protein